MADYLVRVSHEGLKKLSEADLAKLTKQERVRGRELVAQGIIKVLWRIPEASFNYGVWSAPDRDALHAVFESLPIFPYVEFDVTLLQPHPVMTGDDSDLEQEREPNDELS